MTAERRGTADAAVRPRVTVVAQASPAQGGITSFAETIVAAPGLLEDFDMELLNTTRRAVRVGGEASLSNVRNAVVDAGRVYRAARRSDIVHIQTALMPLLPLVRAVALSAAARLGGARVLCHVHSGRVNSGRAEAFSPDRGTRIAMRALAVAHQLLTCSDRGTDALRRLVPGTPVETVDNAVDLDAFRPGQPEPGTVVLLFLGTLSRRKGLADLLDAAVLLRERGVDGWRLVAVGGAAEVGDAEADALRSVGEAAGLGDAFVGPLSGDALRERVASAGIFVLPSHWEGQPIALLEAMASGLPIVASNVGAVPDVVRDGVEGLLVEPHRPDELADALQRLIKDPDERARMGAASRARVVARHGVGTLAERMAAVYDGALTGS